MDLRQWFEPGGAVRTEYRDTTGDCQFDHWSFYENGGLVRQALDTRGAGSPEVLNHMNGGGHIAIQELASGARGSQPDQKLFLDEAGGVRAQCLLGEDGRKLDTRTLVRDGVVREVLQDTSGDGWADTRQVLNEAGEVVRLDADTNADRRPDVVQVYAGGALLHQDEDSDGDGRVDRRFRGDQSAEVPADARIEGDRFRTLDCGSFDGFWWKR